VHEPQEVAQVVRVSAQLGPQSATVLLAEDEAEVRELAALFLRSAGYTVLAARNGMEALEIAERSIGLIHVLVTDIVMPNMRGPELAKRLKALHPKLKVVYMSGYLEYNSGSGQFLDEGFFLQKPFARDTLVSKVMEALSAKSVVA
jgi:two-component system, cell cycle sensor histidine kinase and response regulator CckA